MVAADLGNLEDRGDICHGAYLQALASERNQISGGGRLDLLKQPKEAWLA